MPAVYCHAAVTPGRAPRGEREAGRIWAINRQRRLGPQRISEGGENQGGSSQAHPGR